MSAASFRKLKVNINKKRSEQAGSNQRVVFGIIYIQKLSMSNSESYAKDLSASSSKDEADMLVRCFKGNALDCILPPQNGKGGLYLGNVDAALNTDLLNLFKIRAVLSVDDKFQHTYFNSKVSILLLRFQHIRP